MDKKVISCAFNIDTARVEIKYADGSMIAIDCTLVEAEVARNIYESSELEWLVDYSARWEPLVRRTGNLESGHSETAAPGAGSQQPGAGFYGIFIRSAPDPVHILHALSGSWQDPSERYLSYRHHA